MKHILLLAPALVLLAQGAHAATLRIEANAFYTLSDDTADEARANILLDSDEPPLTGSVSAAQVPPDLEGFAQSRAEADLGALEMDVRAEARKAAGTPESGHRSFSYADYQEEFTAQGAGTVTVRLGLRGNFDVLSDIADESKLSSFSSQISVDGLGSTHFAFFGDNDGQNPYFDALTANFATSIAVTFDVADGDMFKVRTYLAAVAGNDDVAGPTVEKGLEFFDTNVFLSGTLSVETGGTELLTGENDTVAPVPLPAGLPLLMAGIGCFALGRRLK